MSTKQDVGMGEEMLDAGPYLQSVSQSLNICSFRTFRWRTYEALATVTAKLHCQSKCQEQ